MAKKRSQSDWMNALLAEGIQVRSARDAMQVIGWLDSGNFALNWAVSGRLLGGYPLGHTGEIFGDPSTGKAQPVDTPILTPNGWVNLGTVRVGDFVIGMDGNPTKVTGVHPQGKRPVWQLTFSDGSQTRAAGDHIWCVQTMNARRRVKAGRRTKEWQLKTTEELIAAGLRWEDGCRKWIIPLVAPIQFSEKKLPVDPYVLGVLLGDGCLRGSAPSFNSVDAAIVARVGKSVPKGVRCRRRKHGSAYGLVWSNHKNRKNPVTAALHSFGLMGKYSYEKWVPEVYLFGSPEQRLALLRGLMDTDGYVDKSASAAFSSTSRRLTESVVFLVRSLGGVASEPTQHSSWLGKCRHRDAYCTTVSLPVEVNPFHLPRKRNRFALKQRMWRRTISSIDVVASAKCVCISVAAPDGLYVTESMIVTHNSFLAARVIAMAQEAGGVALLDDPEGAYNDDRSESIGIDLDNLPMRHSKTVKAHLETTQGFLAAYKKIKPEGPGVLVLDSLAQLSTVHELEVGLDKRDMTKAAELKAFYRMIGAELLEVPVLHLATNHTIANIGNPFQSRTTGGGGGPKFMATFRLDMRAVSKIRQGTGETAEVIGVLCRVVVDKNRLVAPWKEVRLAIPFHKPISRASGLVQLLTSLGVLEERGAFLFYHGTKIGRAYKVTNKNKFLEQDTIGDELLDKYPEVLEETDVAIAAGSLAAASAPVVEEDLTDEESAAQDE